MKNTLLTCIVILLSAGVYAQPQLLSCTETAFNFSFSLPANGKIAAPRMGPADIINKDYDYVPGWYLKVRYAEPETYLPRLSGLQFNAAVDGNAIGEGNYLYLLHPKVDEPNYLLPAANIFPSAKYTALKPGFLLKPNQL